MATNFANKTCSQLLTYAKGGVADAAKVCPKAKALYQEIANTITVGGGCSDQIINSAAVLPGLRSGLSLADQQCHNEAEGSAPANTGGRVVEPEVKPSVPAPAVNTQVPPAAAGMGGGFVPWLIVGGLGAAVLLFGKVKGRKKSKR